LRTEAGGSSSVSDDTDEIDEPHGKKGKRKTIYGLDNDKWYRANNAKPEVAKAISEVNGEPDFDTREEVYNKYREAIIAVFRSSKKGIHQVIHQVCDGFFLDYRHMAHQFGYMTGAPPLTQNVKTYLRTFLDNIEMFLRNQVKTVEFQEELVAVEGKCETEGEGSNTMKDIFLLRAACQHFNTGSGWRVMGLQSRAALTS